MPMPGIEYLSTYWYSKLDVVRKLDQAPSRSVSQFAC